MKSKPSMTASRTTLMHMTTAGVYPNSMDDLVDSNGHVSLDPDDYRPYSQDEVESFLASQPYEVHASFSGGRVEAMDSNFNTWRYSAPSYLEGASPGSTSFHNHPESNEMGYEIAQIFSASDVAHFASESGGFGPSSFVVRSYDGMRFQLDYKGGGSKSAKSFAAAYKKAYESNVKKAKDYAFNYEGPSRGVAAAKTTELMDSWLKSNAGKYGFKYGSTRA